MKSVDMAGLRRVRRVCHAIQPHAPTTERIARMVTHRCILTSNANKDPVLARIVAGNANGKTQHTPQATAPVESVMAVTPAAFEPGGSLGGVFTTEAEVAHAHDDGAGAFADELLKQGIRSLTRRFGRCDREANFVSCLAQLKGKECAARPFVADHFVHALARLPRVAQFQYEIATLIFPERVLVQGGNPGKPVLKRPGRKRAGDGQCFNNRHGSLLVRVVGSELALTLHPQVT